MTEAKLTVTIKDGDVELPVHITAMSHGIIVTADGHGDLASPDGDGYPIFISHNNGKLLLYVWADINQEDPTHVIELDGALETARQPVSPADDPGE